MSTCHNSSSSSGVQPDNHLPDADLLTCLRTVMAINANYNLNYVCITLCMSRFRGPGVLTPQLYRLGSLGGDKGHQRFGVSGKSSSHLRRCKTLQEL